MIFVTTVFATTIFANMIFTNMTSAISYLVKAGNPKAGNPVTGFQTVASKLLRELRGVLRIDLSERLGRPDMVSCRLLTRAQVVLCPVSTDRFAPEKT